MKIIKKLILTIILSLSITIITPISSYQHILIVDAHSGRTDSSGGHHDYKNKSGLGSYHYHHGYPAHLHTGGICPYANGYTNSSSSSASTIANTSDTSSTNVTSNSTTQNSNITQTSSSTSNTVVQAIVISDTSYDNVAFNASYYANKYEDLYKAFGDNAKALYDHFISSGMSEGRQSSEQFSILVYKENNQDLMDAFGEDLIKYYNHFLEYGVNENRISK